MVKRKLSISHRFYLILFALCGAAILITGIACLALTTSIGTGDLDTTISDVAVMVAEMPGVRTMLEQKEENPDVTAALDGISSLSQVDVLVVCDTDSVRYYHTVHDRIGNVFVGGDEQAILNGEAPYISVATGTLGLQRRAFAPVKDESGEIIGFVMTSVLNSRLDSIRQRNVRTFFFLFLVLLGVSILLARAFQGWLLGVLHGHNPEEFANLYIERGEVLDALEEGVFAVNTEGRLMLMNRSARQVLELAENVQVEGKPLKDFYPETGLPQTAKTGQAENNISMMIHGRNILSSRIPIRREGKLIGAAAIFRDKTDAIALAEKLTGANTLLDTLRAFNHEFTNKLHVILGYLEIGEYEQAKKYILDTSLVSGQAVSDIRNRVPDPLVAALLIGKLMRAHELGIVFVLKQDSVFLEKKNGLPSDVYITLLGNLLENAIEELNRGEFEEKRVELGIYTDESHTTILCDDTGGGIPEEILVSIYDPHTSTKGKGRGSGFAQIRRIVDLYEGTIHIDAEPGEGTSIQIDLPL